MTRSHPFCDTVKRKPKLQKYANMQKSQIFNEKLLYQKQTPIEENIKTVIKRKL